MRKPLILVIAAALAATLTTPAFARDRHHDNGHHRDRGHGGVSIQLGGGYGGVYRGPVYAPRGVYYDDSYYYGARPYRQQYRPRYDRHHRSWDRHGYRGYDRHHGEYRRGH